MIPRTRLAALAGTVLALAASVVVVTGCVIKPITGTGPCDWMHAKKSSKPGRTAVLVDTSNSTRSSFAGSEAPDYAAALKPALDQAVGRQDTVEVVSFSGTTSDLAAASGEMSADYKAEYQNPKNRSDGRTATVTCLSDAVAKAQAATPAAPGTDVLRAIDSAASWLAEGTGTKRLLVATDGLVTTGCAELVHAGMDSSEEIDAIARLCAGTDKEVRPDELKGVDIAMFGVGHPAPSQPVPTSAQVQWLVQLWEKLCQQAGAQSVDVSTAAVAGDGKANGAKPSTVTDPVVSFHKGTAVYSLPPAFFDTGSAQLRPDTIPAVVDIAVSIRTTNYKSVEVVGYADPRGDDGLNQTLSNDRAASVAEVLADQQVGKITQRGGGVTTTCPYQLTVPSTAGVDERLQCYRRVDIIVTLA